MAYLTLTNVVPTAFATDIVVAAAELGRTASGAKVGCRIPPASLSFRHLPSPADGSNLEPARWQDQKPDDFGYMGKAALRAGRSVRQVSGSSAAWPSLGRERLSVVVPGSRPGTYVDGSRLRHTGRATADKRGII